jgi:hypothetical protein
MLGWSTPLTVTRLGLGRCHDQWDSGLLRDVADVYRLGNCYSEQSGLY